MAFYKRVEDAEKEILEMQEKIECEKFEECYIRKLIGRQKGELEVPSIYYKGNIAEGNWSLIKEDSDIKRLDEDTVETKEVDAIDVIFGLDSYEKEECDEYTREKDAEYQYVFLPSYYAVKTLIIYYLRDRKQAKKIYGLKNAVVRHIGDKFYGGLPFILKYLKEIYTKRKSKEAAIKFDFADIMQKIYDLKSNNINDDFINDIIDCIGIAHCGYFILDKRIDDFKTKREEMFSINFREEIEKKGELLNYLLIEDYTILMHRDVEKDLELLKKGQKEKAREKIHKTPNHPNNDSPRDSEKLKGDLKGWFSQRISQKDRLVYKKDSDEKTVYIAAAYSHYDEAQRRIKKTEAYRIIKDC